MRQRPKPPSPAAKNMQGNMLASYHKGRLHIRMIFHHLYRNSGTHGIVFLCPRGKASQARVSLQVKSLVINSNHCSAFSTQREIWSVARFYGLAATTDKRKRRERASVSLYARNFERENGFAVGEKVAKKKGQRERQRAVLQFRLARGLSHLKRHDRHCLIKERLLKIPLSA